MKQVTWIGGWGVAPEMLRPAAARLWPQARHAFFPPSCSSVEAIAGADLVVGWSLGACRILDAAVCGTRFQGQVLLLAPFLAFCSEYSLGGKCALVQVKWLRRWVQRDPIAALADFHMRAELSAPPAALPYGSEDLLAGLDRLAEDALPRARDYFAKGLPSGWTAVVGDRDPLLDAEAVARSLPGCTVAPGAGHSAEELLTTRREVLHAL